MTITTTMGFGSFTDSIARPDRALAMIGAERTPMIERMFSILLWDVQSQEVVAHSDIDPAGRSGKAEYYFRVPPKVHEMDEPFASHITATQGGGKYVESFGSILKEIRVSGTTGLRPKKSAPREVSILGVTESQIRSLGENPVAVRSIPAGEATGIDDIIFLRNMFRLYSDNKSNEALSRTRIMVWRNARTDDFWVVEPKDFKLVQNAQSPLTYQYSMTLTALTRFEAVVGAVEDPQQAARDRRRVMSRIQEYSQKMTEIYLHVASSITRIQGAGYFGLNTVLSPMLSTLRGLNEIKRSGDNAYRGLTAVTRDLASELTSGIANLVAYTPAQDPIVRDLRRAIILCARILTEDIFQDTSAATAPGRRARAAAAYNEPATSTAPARAPKTHGSGSFIGNAPRTDRLAQGEVLGGETIRDCARRLCGSTHHWHVLVILNDLRAPYFARTRSDGVLIPGDAIMYPSSSGAADAHMITEINPSTEEGDESRASVAGPLVRAYGRDIALQTVDNTFDLADIQINNFGDLSTVAGIDNVDQAIKIKFATEQGELTCHRYFGARFPIGSKATIQSFNEFRINVISTLKSDSRIERIRSLKFNTVGDVFTISADLALSKTRDNLQTNFALRQT